MEGIQNIYYALGHLVYAVALSDGQIQPEERNHFERIVEDEIKSKNLAFDYSAIIFKVLQKQGMDADTIFDWGMDHLRKYKQYLNPKVKSDFYRILVRVAKAYPPIEAEEQRIIDRFKTEIADF